MQNMLNKDHLLLANCNKIRVQIVKDTLMYKLDMENPLIKLKMLINISKEISISKRY